MLHDCVAFYYFLPFPIPSNFRLNILYLLLLIGFEQYFLGKIERSLIHARLTDLFISLNSHNLFILLLLKINISFIFLLFCLKKLFTCSWSFSGFPLLEYIHETSKRALGSYPDYINLFIDLTGIYCIPTMCEPLGIHQKQIQIAALWPYILVREADNI